MPFFQVDDQLPVNRKTKTLIAPALAGDPLGLAAGHLWTLAGASSQAALTDGLLSLFDLLQILPMPDLVPELARRLVAAGFWHEAGHGCEVCEPVPEGSWRFHDWWQMRYDRGEVVKTTRRKRAELQKPEVVDAVWARDCLDPKQPTRAACRYCGKVVNRKDTRSPRDDRAQLDHVDPTSARGVRNLVVACGGCNSTKGKRTPAQAGMTLHPAPRSSQDDVVLSPAGGDAGTVATVSPPPAAAGSPTTPSAGDQDQTGTSVETSLVPAVEKSPRARHVRGAGSGEGSGSPTGSGTGKPHPDPTATLPASSPTTDPTPAPRRRRRRGKGTRTRIAAVDEVSPTWDAGPAPDVPVSGRFGSPWHGWTGPPSPLGDEHHCPTHGLPMPCRRCTHDLEGDPA